MSIADLYPLQHTATHCNTLQHTATHRNTLQHTATHCNTLEHRRVISIATHCNTLQHRCTSVLFFCGTVCGGNGGSAWSNGHGSRRVCAVEKWKVYFSAAAGTSVAACQCVFAFYPQLGQIWMEHARSRGWKGET